ncbi:MAG: hypothetical protein Q4G25_04050 [Paracoccus sp. (in: a-proteobacteria)]|nr:hypothetical protein [Paracoccus sp. (in: a-proteobacteria)]
MFRIALATFMHERRRYVPIIVVVTLAGLLMIVQIAVALGVVRDAASPITRSTADLWAGPPAAMSLSDGRTLEASAASAMWLIPELTRIEPYSTRFGELSRTQGNEAEIPGETPPSSRRYVNVLVVSTDADAMLYARHLPAEMRRALTEPGTIVTGAEDAAAIGVAPGGRIYLDGRAFRLVGVLNGMGGLGMSSALIGTASLPAPASGGGGAEAGEPAQAPAFWLVGLRAGTSAERRAEIAATLNSGGQLSILTATELEQATMSQFALESGAGTIFLGSAAVALAVAALIVNQTMSSAIAAATREYAALRAFGVGFRRLVALVLMQGALAALASVAVLAVMTGGLLMVLERAQIPHALPLPLAMLAAGAIVLVVLLSNLFALRRLRAVDPAALLR